MGAQSSYETPSGSAGSGPRTKRENRVGVVTPPHFLTHMQGVEITLIEGSRKREMETAPSLVSSGCCRLPRLRRRRFRWRRLGDGG